MALVVSAIVAMAEVWVASVRPCGQQLLLTLDAERLGGGSIGQPVHVGLHRVHLGAELALALGQRIDLPLVIVEAILVLVEAVGQLVDPAETRRRNSVRISSSSRR